jgi:DNA-binding MarR family transcriptional regulator
VTAEAAPEAAARVPTQEELTDAVLAASRALVAIAVRSLAAAGEDVTLPQYRALVVLGYRGQQRVAELAAELGVNSSTATRLAGRLEAKGLVRRYSSPEDRRATCVQISDEGTAVVVAVTRRRRREISRVLRTFPPSGRRALLDALQGFADAAGEGPEQSWTLGWTS